MRRSHYIAVILVITTVAAMAPVRADERKTDIKSVFRATIRPFVKSRCEKCHGPDMQKGELSLHDVSGNVVDDSLAWVKVLQQLTHRKMRPEGEPVPATSELERVTR